MKRSAVSSARFRYPRVTPLPPIGLVVGERLTRSEQFILKLKLAKWMLLLYTVRYCEPVGATRSAGAQRFRVGAELCGHVDTSNQNDPQAILAALIAESANSADFPTGSAAVE